MSLVLAILAFAAQDSATGDGAPALAPAPQEVGLPQRENLRYPEELRFGAIRRLTTSGENAEGYFDSSGTRIVYQAKIGDAACDQIFLLDLLTGARRLVSTGTGRTTCSYFLPGDERVLFASTHGAADDCLEPPDYSMGYVWKIYPQFELYVRDLRTWELEPLLPAEGYDAECVVSPDGSKIVFTSRRNGDLDLYVADADGSGLRQVTDRLGYDGGAFFSPDSKKLVWRSYYPESEEEIARYRELLARDVIEPMALQVWTMNVDGSDKFQVTDNGAANFGPYWHPDGERIIYSSNQNDPQGRNFDLYLINADGSGNERVTYCPSFDGFPMFSHDGTRLIFASNRANRTQGDTNLFLAEWLDDAAPHEAGD